MQSSFIAEKLLEQASSRRCGTDRLQARTDLEEQNHFGCYRQWQGRASSLPQCGPACRACSPDSCL